MGIEKNMQDFSTYVMRKFGESVLFNNHKPFKQNHAELFDAWQAAKASAVPACEWSHDSDEDMHGTWHTKCGNSFVLNEDGHAENRMNHCCYCGGKLIEAQEPSNDS